MKIAIKKVLVKDLFDGYADNGENGVVGYGGKLDIRPPFQREFVYAEKQRDAVIDTWRKGFPLNVMYWSKTKTGWEVLDGQQRTLSICQFLNREFSVTNANGNPQYIHNIEASNPDEYEKMMNYELTVYECEGSDDEKLEWFKVINIAGETLSEQELRNAVYAGTWLADAKLYFSKLNCAGNNLSKDYVSCKVNRQELLEIAIKWIALREGISIEAYMAKHQNDSDAQELWVYFQDVIQWVSSRFIKKRKEMKSVDWGYLYKNFGSVTINPNELESTIHKLMMDDDVTKKSGIYPFVLTGDEKYLSIRSFTEQQKTEAYERQNGICPMCKKEGNNKQWELSEMEADHITPWHSGGKTISENCQMLCKHHNRLKSGI